MPSDRLPHELRNLLSIIFCVNCDHGPKVVFRYPHDVDNRSEDRETAAGVFKKHSPINTELLSSRELLDKMRDSSLESLLIPRSPEGCQKRFVVMMDSLLFAGYPFLAHPDSKHMYNVVFVVESRTPPHIIDSLISLSTRMSVALAYEERIGAYLTENLTIMDACYREADIPLKEHIDPHKLEDDDIFIVEKCPFSEMIADAGLACTLSKVYDSIRNTLAAKVLINRTINFSFFIPLSPARNSSIRSSVAPFESFIILEDANLIKSNLSADSCPSLLKLLNLPRPYFRSLRDIAFSIDVDYDEVCRAVLALVRWRKALIVYPVVSNNEYMVSHMVPISQYPTLSDQFADQFPGFSFHAELSKFSVRRSLSEILDCFQSRDTVESYKMIVVWLLRRKLLVQLFAHVYIRPASDSWQSASGGSEEERAACPSLTRGSYMSEAMRLRHLRQYLSPSQYRRIGGLPDMDASMLTNLAKVLTHAHQGTTLEEILWRTNLQPQELHDVIYRTFSEFLVTVRHPTHIY